MGLNEACELNIMIPGHTKFGPDRFFGLIKRKYRRTNLSSLAEIAKVVETSTAGGQNKAYIIGNEQLSKPFHYYNWADFLANYYNTLPQITSYYHFRFDKGHHGIVFVRKFANAEEMEITIIKPNTCIDRSALPSEIIPSGLSEERKQYLFEHVRPFCDERYHVQGKNVHTQTTVRLLVTLACVYAPIADNLVIPRLEKVLLHVLNYCRSAIVNKECSMYSYPCINIIFFNKNYSYATGLM